MYLTSNQPGQTHQYHPDFTKRLQTKDGVKNGRLEGSKCSDNEIFQVCHWYFLYKSLSVLCCAVNLIQAQLKILTTIVVYSTRLFSEGGNFTPQEIEVFQSHLEKMDKRIDSAEGAMMQDMEEKESKCLEQVKISSS